MVHLLTRLCQCAVQQETVVFEAWVPLPSPVALRAKSGITAYAVIRFRDRAYRYMIILCEALGEGIVGLASRMGKAYRSAHGYSGIH